MSARRDERPTSARPAGGDGWDAYQMDTSRCKHVHKYVTRIKQASSLSRSCIEVLHHDFKPDGWDAYQGDTSSCKRVHTHVTYIKQVSSSLSSSSRFFQSRFQTRQPGRLPGGHLPLQARAQVSDVHQAAEILSLKFFIKVLH